MQLYPVLNDLMQSMNKVRSLLYSCRKSCLMHALSSLFLILVSQDQAHALVLLQIAQLPSDFSGKVKMKNWISKLHKMPASRELDENDSRQLLFDLESSYNDFMAFLNIGQRS